MGDYTPEQLEEALRPIASLISKSEKAQHKLAPGTWQHTMMGDNVRALRVASALMGATPYHAVDLSQEGLEESLTAIRAMIERVEATAPKFEVGTSQHSLQRNRLDALRIAEAVVEEELATRDRQGRPPATRRCGGRGSGRVT